MAGSTDWQRTDKSRCKTLQQSDIRSALRRELILCYSPATACASVSGGMQPPGLARARLKRR